MTSFNIDFQIPENYTYDPNKIDVSGGKVSLKLITEAPEEHVELFDNDTGFIYDNTKSEFTSGLVRQKDVQPLDSLIWATYTASLNANYAPSGSLVATLIDSPYIDNNRLACIGGVNVGLYYANDNIESNPTAGAIKLKFTPNYNGSPATDTNIFEIGEGIVNRNKIILFHSLDGNLKISTYNSISGVQLNAYSIGAWSPVFDTTYEIELNFNTVTGEFRLFINGIQLGSIPITIYTRTGTANRLYVGAGTLVPIARGYYEDIIMFSTVQHTTNYAPGYELPENKYVENVVQLPLITKTGIGFFISADSFTTSQVDSPRYVVQKVSTGDYYYWNGVNWVLSDMSYNQASNANEVNTNLNLFDIFGETQFRIAIIFPDSATQSSVSQTNTLFTPGSYPIDQPTIYKTLGDRKSLLSWISFIVTLGGGNQGNVYFQFSKNGVIWEYWNGSTWTDAINPTDYNTSEEVNENIKNYDDNQDITLYVKAFLVSNGTQQIELENILISYVHQYECPVLANVQDSFFGAKKGNSCALNVLITTPEYETVEDLNLANSITFMLKKKNTDDNTEALVTKTLNNGIVIDNPETGYVRIILEAQDLEILAGDYYPGLEIRWDDNVKEVYFLKDKSLAGFYKIIQDVIR